MTLRRLPGADRVAVPWRNGGGETLPVTAAGERADGSFSWRVSIATIAVNGEFSVFPGVDRFLMPLGAHGLVLDIDGERRSLAQHEVVDFQGEVDVAACEVDAPSADLNLMVDRRRCAGSLVAQWVDDALTVSAAVGETVVLIALSGGLSAARGESLDTHDALELVDGASCTLSGRGRIAVARIRALG